MITSLLLKHSNHSKTQSTYYYYQSGLISSLINRQFLTQAHVGLKKFPIYNICKRFMMSSRCVYVARAAYHTVQILSNSETLDKINKNKIKPLIQEIVHSTLNDNHGIIQHKSTLWKHISNQQFPAEHFYDAFRAQTSYQNVTYEANALVDFRTNNEVGSLAEYLRLYNQDIQRIHATCDKQIVTFHKAKQSNVDFIVYIDRALGLRSKITYQDEKSGKDMLKHSTKGSIGTLSYDQNGNNIQVTSSPIEIEDIINYNTDKIKMIRQSLKNEGISNETFDSTLIKARNISEQMKGKSYTEFAQLHNDLQYLLWKDIQCNPEFKQSISFVFLKQIINQPLTSREHVFSQTFQSKLQPNKMYDLNKRGDLNEFYKAFIYAGKEIDPQFIEKLNYLHHNGLTLNNNILLVLADLTKHGLY